MNIKEPILPRLIRLKDASRYLGMDRHRFDKEVRPSLIEIPIGIQGIAFDRLDLDKWVDYYKQRSGRPSNKRLDQIWDAKECPVFTSVGTVGTSIKRYSDDEYAKALERTLCKRRKSASHGVSKN